MSAEQCLLVHIYDESSSYVLELQSPIRYENLVSHIAVHVRKTAEVCWKAKKPGTSTLVDLKTLSGEILGNRLEVFNAQANSLQSKPKTITLVPKPLVAHQEVMPLFEKGVKGAIEELIDNSLPAVMSVKKRLSLDKHSSFTLPPGWSPTIWIKFVDCPQNGQDQDAMLVVEDNGVAMSEKVLSKYLTMAATFSQIPEVKRGAGPMCIDEYVNPALSRFGLGCTVLTGFGTRYKITSRELGSDVSNTLLVDYEEIQRDYDKDGIGWRGTMTPKFYLDQEEESPRLEPSDPSQEFDLPFGTRICISNLRPGPLKELRDPITRKALAAQISQDYELFKTGMPSAVKDHVPLLLKRNTAQVSGLVLNVFGFSVDSSQQPWTPIIGPSKSSARRTAGHTAGRTPGHRAGLSSPGHGQHSAASHAGPSSRAAAEDAEEAAGLNTELRSNEEVASLHKMLYEYEEICKRRPDNKPFLLFLRYVPRALAEEHRLNQACKQTIEIDDDMPAATDGLSPELTLKKTAEAARILLETGVLPTATGQVGAGCDPQVSANKKTGGKGLKRDRRSLSTPPPNASANRAAGGGSAGAKKAAGSCGRKQMGAEEDEDQLPPPLIALERDPTKTGPPKYVDMMLILRYFPTEDGQATKPNAGKGASQSEPFIFPFWSGRLMPKCKFMEDLPRIVGQAVELGKYINQREATIKLDSRHLAGELFISLEANVTTHKTDLEDEAYEAFKRFGAEPSVALGCKPSVDLRTGLYGTLHTFDFEADKFVADPSGSLATRMLLAHFSQHWRTLDQEGRIVGDSCFDKYPFDQSGTIVRQGDQYQLGNSLKFKDPICKGELVRLVTPDRGVAAAETEESLMAEVGKADCAVDFYVVERFYECGLEVQYQHKVALRKWRPSWSSSPSDVMPKNIVEIMPLDFSERAERLKRAAELAAEWEDNYMPHHLAFEKVAGQQGQKKLQKGSKRDNIVTTRDASQAKGLSNRKDKPYILNDSTQRPEFQVHLVCKSGKPLSLATVNKHCKAPHIASSKIRASLQMLNTQKGRNNAGGTSKGQLWHLDIDRTSPLWTEYSISDFLDAITEAGQYLMKIELLEENWTPEEKALFPPKTDVALEYRFSVEHSVPVKAVIRFGDETGHPHMHLKGRLGVPLKAKLIMTLLDRSGLQVPFPPFSTETVKSVLTLTVFGDKDRVDREVAAAGATSSATYARDFIPLAEECQPMSGDFILEMQERRFALWISNITVNSFSLGGGSRSVGINAELALPGRELLVSDHLVFSLYSGVPVGFFLRCSGSSEIPIAKGENLANWERLKSDGSELTVHLCDVKKNVYIPDEDLDGPAAPPIKAELEVTNASYLQGRDASRVHPKRTIKLENGSFIIPDLWARGPVGSFATVSIRIHPSSPVLFSGELIVYNRQIFHVHLGFGHPLLDDSASNSKNVKKGRGDRGASLEGVRDVSCESSLRSTLGRDKACADTASESFEGLVRLYCLDLMDRIPRFTSNKNGLSEVKALNKDALSLALDFQDGIEVMPDGSILTPDGSHYTHSRKETFVKILNKRMADGKAVHDVVCVVEPKAKYIRGMRVTVCDARDDKRDPLWQSDIKLKLINTRNSHQCWDLPNLRYSLDAEAECQQPTSSAREMNCSSKYMDDMPFEVALPPDLFMSGPNAELIFCDCHNPAIDYGKLYIRQASQPTSLQLLPIGSTFVGAEVQHTSKITGCLSHAHADKGQTNQVPARASGNTSLDGGLGTLQGWKLTSSTSINSAFNFEHLTTDVQILQPGPQVHLNIPFRLYFRVVDQYGILSKLTSEMQASVERQARLIACLTSDAEDEVCGVEASIGASNGPTVQQHLISCEIVAESWSWHELACSASSQLPPWTCFSFCIVLRSGRGPVSVTLSLDPSLEGEDGNNPDMLPGHGVQSQLSPITHLKSVTVPVYIASARMKQDGYKLHASSSASGMDVEVLRVQSSAACDEDPQRLLHERCMTTQQGDGASAQEENQSQQHQEPTQDRQRNDYEDGLQSPIVATVSLATQEAVYHVICREEDELDLQIQLIDEQDQAIVGPQGAAMLALCPTLLSGGWSSGQTLKCQKVGVIRVSHLYIPRRSPEPFLLSSEDALLSKYHPVAVHHMMLKPSGSPSIAHALPLHVVLVVQAGRYPNRLESVPTKEWHQAEPHHFITLPQTPDPQQTCLHVELPCLQLKAADGSTWQAPSAGSANRGRPRRGLQTSQSAQEEEAACRGLVCWQWCRLEKRQTGGGEGFQVAECQSDALQPVKVPISSLLSNASTTMRDIKVAVPTRAGLWSLVASLQGTEIPAVQAARVLILASPKPCSVRLHTAMPDGTILPALEPRCPAVQRPNAAGTGEAGPVAQREHDLEIPGIYGSLVDCFGNRPLLDGNGYKVELIVRPSLGDKDHSSQDVVLRRSDGMPIELVVATAIVGGSRNSFLFTPLKTEKTSNAAKSSVPTVADASLALGQAATCSASLQAADCARDRNVISTYVLDATETENNLHGPQQLSNTAIMDASLGHQHAASNTVTACVAGAPMPSLGGSPTAAGEVVEGVLPHSRADASAFVTQPVIIPVSSSATATATAWTSDLLPDHHIISQRWMSTLLIELETQIQKAGLTEEWSRSDMQHTYDLFLRCTSQQHPAASPSHDTASLSDGTALHTFQHILTTATLVSNANEKTLQDLLNKVLTEQLMMKRQMKEHEEDLKEAESAVLKWNQELNDLETSALDLTNGKDVLEMLHECEDQIKHHTDQLEVRGGMIPMFSDGRDIRTAHLLRPWAAMGTDGSCRGNGLGSRHAAFFENMEAIMCKGNRQVIGPGQVIGPVICLGAVERQSVAEALTVLLGGFNSLFDVVVNGENVQRAVCSQFKSKNLDHSVLDLQDDNVRYIMSNYGGGGLNKDDQQTLRVRHPYDSILQLNKEVSRGSRGHPDQAAFQAFRFVGFAVNLIHLSDAQLQLRVVLPARTGQAGPRVSSLSLRESLFAFLFRDAMVFEEESDMYIFKDHCKHRGIPIKGRLICLDGTSFNLRTGVSSFRKAQTSTMALSGTCIQRQLSSPLDMFVHSIAAAVQNTREYMQRLSLIPAKRRQVTESLEAARHDLENRRSCLETCKKKVEPELKKRQDREQQLKKELQALKGMRMNQEHESVSEAARCSVGVAESFGWRAGPAKKNVASSDILNKRASAKKQRNM